MKIASILVLAVMGALGGVAACASASDDASDDSGEALSRSGGKDAGTDSGKGKGKDAGTGAGIGKGGGTGAAVDAGGTKEQYCLAGCLANDSKAKDIVTKDLACFQPCVRKGPNDQASCISACDKQTSDACQANQASCQLLDQCSAICFDDDQARFGDPAPGWDGTFGDDPCSDSYYGGMYDEISGLGYNDDGEFDDMDGDGWDDDSWDDMAYRYGPTHARCWDYDDGSF